MMKKWISVSQAQKQLSSILHDVHENGTVYMIQRYNRRITLICRPEEYRKMAVYRTEVKLHKLYKQILEALKEYS